MTRILGISALLAAGLLGTAATRPGQAQTPEEFAQTAAFAAARQNKDGGFSATAGEASNLGATNSALKVLKHVGGSVPDILGCVKFVKSCRDAGGGFAPTPGGKPGVVTTAIGLMAAAELRIADEPMIQQAIAYLGKNAQSFEDVRMSIAGLEAVKTPSPDFPRWKAQIEAMRNPEGTFGKGAEEAFATGGAAAAILRMGLALDKRDAVAAALKAGQRSDGARSKDAGPSDLASTYRIMRALYMLQEKPDAERLLGYIARCRRPDGSYASTPDGPGNLGGTYLATIVIHWLRLSSGLPAVVETAGRFPLVNGKDLTGWEGNTQFWSVRDGLLIGRSPGLDHNEFLAAVRPYRDFSLTLDFRLVDGKGNSGVQFRSVRVPGTEMSGYQADIGEGYWGSLYDESRRNKMLAPARPEAARTLHKTDWNHYQINAMGEKILLFLNRAASVQYRETDEKIARDGLIAVQIHAGGPMEIQFKDILIQPMPAPTADNTNQPGFHLRTVQTEDGERRYTVYVPEGYDGSRAYPVVLFLHGAGERGQDGITPAQVGIGPAIFNRSGGIPAIAVFPQARQTWAAGSADSKAALRALEDVMTAYKTDPKRVILTGLSMGGHGSWDLAAREPERFAAVLPICGGGKPEDAAKLKALPVWSFCGDEDSLRTLLNMRSMVEAIQREGGTARITEYRSVGHPSWDRVYNDHEVIDWMLAQHRP
jgi:predicted esterase/prenyltransferase beta subunit